MLTKPVQNCLIAIKEKLNELYKKFDTAPTAEVYTLSLDVDPKFQNLPSPNGLKEIVPPNFKSYFNHVQLDELKIKRAIVINGPPESFDAFQAISLELSQILKSIQWNSIFHSLDIENAKKPARNKPVREKIVRKKGVREKSLRKKCGRKKPAIAKMVRKKPVIEKIVIKTRPRTDTLDWPLHLFELVEAKLIKVNNFSKMSVNTIGSGEKFEKVFHFASRINPAKDHREKAKNEKEDLEEEKVSYYKSPREKDDKPVFELTLKNSYCFKIHNLFLASSEAIELHLNPLTQNQRTDIHLSESEQQIYNLLRSVAPKRLSIPEIKSSNLIDIGTRQLHKLLGPQGKLRKYFGVFWSKQKPTGFGVEHRWWHSKRI